MERLHTLLKGGIPRTYGDLYFRRSLQVFNKIELDVRQLYLVPKHVWVYGWDQVLTNSIHQELVPLLSGLNI